MQDMGNNKENMRQAMKELLGLVGFGPEAESTGESPAEQVTPVEQVAPIIPPVVEAPKVEEPPKAEPPKATPVVEAKAEQPVAAPATDLEETRQRVAATVERSFFGFGARKEQVPEPVFQVVQPEEVPESKPFFISEEEEPTKAPFIRPGATIIAAGATFFGDIRAEGDVEVLGKLKGNLEATGNVRITGKVLGDVKGEAVVLDGGTVQGNITSTTMVGIDVDAMVVGDILATDLTSGGKIKGNLQIGRSAEFGATALLAGNIITTTIMLAQGARVQGAVRIAEDPDSKSLFGELEI